MKSSMAGVLSPRAAARLDFAPSLNLDEIQPMLFTVTGSGTIAIQIEPSCIFLTNLTDKHAPYVLLLAPKLTSLEAFFDAIRARLGG